MTDDEKGLRGAICRRDGVFANRVVQEILYAKLPNLMLKLHALVCELSTFSILILAHCTLAASPVALVLRD